MGDVIALGLRHAASRKLNAELSIGSLRFSSSAVIRLERKAGIPRRFQPLTVEGSTSSKRATAAVPPSDLISTAAGSILDYYLRLANLSRACRAQFENSLENAYNKAMRSMEAVAHRLLVLRRALKLNGKEMGRICKIKPTMWSLYENGERPLTLNAAYKIIDGTHGAVDLNYLYEGKLDGVRHSLAIQLQRGAA